MQEALREADHSQFEASCQLDGRRVAERDLDAAATDVDDHRARASHVHAIDGRLMNHPGFLGSRDDARTDAHFVLDPREELASVA